MTPPGPAAPVPHPSRVLLLVVLAAGAVGSIAPIARQPELLRAVGAPPPQRPWDEQTLAPVVALLRAGADAGEPAFVLAPRPDPWNWLRYLAYPRRLAYLPAGATPAWLAGRLPPGRSVVVLVAPEAAPLPAPDVSSALRARLAATHAERVLSAPDARMDVYRLTR